MFQQLLGKNYKWFFIVKFYAKSFGTGVYGFLISQISDLLQNTTIVYVWVLNNPNPQIITYLVLGRIYKALSDTYVAEIIGPEIITGQLTKNLLYPTNYIHFTLFKEIGRRFVFNFWRATAFLVTILFFYSYLDFHYFNLTTIPLFLLFLPISFLTTFYTEVCIGLIAFFVTDKRSFTGIHRAYNGLSGVLSGIIIPLDKLPFYSIIQFLPTTWILHYPMQIFLGKYTFEQSIEIYFAGLGWSIGLYFIAQLIFRLGIKKNESVGL